MQVECGLDGSLVGEDHQCIILVQPSNVDREVLEESRQVLGLDVGGKLVDVKTGFAFQPVQETQLGGLVEVLILRHRRE